MLKVEALWTMHYKLADAWPMWWEVQQYFNDIQYVHTVKVIYLFLEWLHIQQNAQTLHFMLCGYVCKTFSQVQ